MSDNDFFSRWSDRKRRVAQEDREAAVPAEPATAVTPEYVEEQPEETEAQTLERLGLPDPETLGQGDDFRPFMEAGVPDWLRRRALRRLWRSNPVLANLDGLNDYDADFNAPELTGKVLATAYQVGRGILREALADDRPQAGPEEADTPSEASTPEIADAGQAPEAEPETDAGPDRDEARAADDAPRRPRRMTFET